MSVYATWLLIDGDPDGDERALGPPFVYQESHVVPTPDDARQGWLELAGIPAFCGSDPTRLVDFLRVDVSEDNGIGSATIVLDRAQVQAVRDAMTEWLNREVEEG